LGRELERGEGIELGAEFGGWRPELITREKMINDAQVRFNWRGRMFEKRWVQFKRRIGETELDG